MSEPQNQDTGIPFESTIQETSPPTIEITPTAGGGTSLPRSSVLNLDPTPVKEEQKNIPRASTLPVTETTGENTSDATSPSVPREPGTSYKSSTDPAMKSVVSSDTQPTNANPTGVTMPTIVDPNAVVPKVSNTRTLLILAS
jgi:hypothetical protein